MEIAIDHDLVPSISARATLAEDEAKAEVHDLEFGIELGKNGAESDV